MKLYLKMLLLIASIALGLTEPNCSYDEMQKCLKYEPNPSAFMQTRKQLNEFCSIFPQEIACMKDYDSRCGTANPTMQERYEVHEKMFDKMCEKKFQKKYLHHARCLNNALALIGEKCASNDIPLTNNEERCTKIMQQLHCSDDVVLKECGRGALDVFKNIFHSTYKSFVVKPANCMEKLIDEP